MSTLFVDTINEKTSGNGIYIPGHVVQFKKTAYITSTQNTVSTSWADITGASLSITPKSTSSIILIGWAGHLGGTGAFRFLKDGTAINTPSNLYYYFDVDTLNQSTWVNASTRTSFKEEVFDEPSTTSSITYKVQFAAYNITNDGFGINEANVRREGSILYLMEIAG